MSGDAPYRIFIALKPEDCQFMLDSALSAAHLRELVRDVTCERSGRSACWILCKDAPSFYIVLGCLAGRGVG